MKLIVAIAALAVVAASEAQTLKPDWYPKWTRPGWYQVMLRPTGAMIFNGPYDTPECSSEEYRNQGVVCARLEAWPTCEPIMSVECYDEKEAARNKAAEERLAAAKKAAADDLAARVAARTKMLNPNWTGPGWYHVGDDLIVGKFIVAGPFEAEATCRATIVPGDDLTVSYACTRFEKKPSCQQAWNDACPAIDF